MVTTETAGPEVQAEIAPSPVDAGKAASVVEVTLELLSSRMTWHYPLDVNEAAFQAAGLWIDARTAATDQEADRKAFQLAIRDAHAAAGANKGEAEERARVDPRYMAYLAECKRLERVRDRAEVLYKCLYQRAYLLTRGNGPDLVGGDELVEIETRAIPA